MHSVESKFACLNCETNKEEKVYSTMFSQAELQFPHHQDQSSQKLGDYSTLVSHLIKHFVHFVNSNDDFVEGETTRGTETAQ